LNAYRHQVASLASVFRYKLRQLGSAAIDAWRQTMEAGAAFLESASLEAISLEAISLEATSLEAASVESASRPETVDRQEQICL
jgi:hypothetical protein